MHRFCQKV